MGEPEQTSSKAPALMLAAASLLSLLPATPLVLSTEVHAVVVNKLGRQLDELSDDASRSGPSLAAYNACVAQRLAMQAKGPPCEPNDRDCLKERSVEGCSRPGELELIERGDVAGALLSGGQTEQTLRRVLSQRLDAASDQVAARARGQAGCAALSLLACLGAIFSGRSGSWPQGRARLGVLLLAGAALAAMAAMGVGLAGVQGWDDPRLAPSATIIRFGAALAAATALIAGYAALRLHRCHRGTTSKSSDSSSSSSR